MLLGCVPMLSWMPWSPALAGFGLSLMLKAPRASTRAASPRVHYPNAGLATLASAKTLHWANGGSRLGETESALVFIYTRQGVRQRLKLHAGRTPLCSSAQSPRPSTAFIFTSKILYAYEGFLVHKTIIQETYYALSHAVRLRQRRRSPLPNNNYSLESKAETLIGESTSGQVYFYS